LVTATDGGSLAVVVDGVGGIVARVDVGILGYRAVTVAAREATLGAVETDQMALATVRIVNTHKEAQGLHRRTGTNGRLRLAGWPNSCRLQRQAGG
jgi:hypothetical protein